MLVDSHCHLNFTELAVNLDEYLIEMEKNQVKYALCIGTRLDNLTQVVDIANKYNNIFATVGIHPDEVLPNFQSKDIESFLLEPKVVGIGETGLDYYHDNGINKIQQQQRFQTHVELAIQYKLPLVIHTRDSFADIYDILKNNQHTNLSGVMHCFTESIENAKKALDLGFYISLSGIVTFKNATNVIELAKYVPLDRLLIETDSPFLAPVPYRGKLNHPALVTYVANKIAELRHQSLNDIATNTTDNFFKLFKRAFEYLNNGVDQ
jgi:TatD DNase family protein